MILFEYSKNWHKAKLDLMFILWHVCLLKQISNKKNTIIYSLHNVGCGFFMSYTYGRHYV